MINQIFKDAKQRMEKCVDMFKIHIKKIRTGRASPSLLNHLNVDCYGSFIPIYQLASIVAEDSKTLLITVFDNSLSSVIKKAIISSNLGLNPSLNGSSIRISMPPLTEERRRNLIKIVRSEAEQVKVSIRNIRRDANDKIKILLKNKAVGKDEDRRSQDKIQKQTDISIKSLDSILSKKEAELMEI